MPAEVLEVPAVREAGPVPHALLAGLGNVVNTFAYVGSSPTNARNFVISNLTLSAAIPATVLVQPRQSENLEKGYPDVFAIQVIETAVDHIMIHVKRLDTDTGWGQNLRVDILIIEQTHN